MFRFKMFLAATMVFVSVSGAAQAEDQRRITMTGTASIAVKPDIIRITAGVMVQEDKAADAFRIMSDQLNQVADVLSREGIAPADIQTSDLSLGARYGNDVRNQYGEAIVVGYTASSALTVVVRELDRAGDIVEVLVTQGANQINGFAFDISDSSDAAEAARLAAIRDAMAKTLLYTQAADVQAGDIVSIVETGGHVSRPQPMNGMADMMRSVPIAGGTLSVSASVQVVTALE